MADFDGPNLVITLNAPTAGVLDVNVQDDLYSPWKRWMTGISEFDTAADVSSINETVSIVDHSLYTGQRVVYDNLGGTTNIGLTTGTAYFVRRIDRNTFELYDTKTNAEGSPSTTGRLNLTAGATEVQQIRADNSKFLPAFRAAGGDPLTPGVEAGAYFFLRNDLGWRIVSTDENQTVNYQGNLVGEDANASLINTTPSRSVLHLGLQPVTQRVDEILELTQDAQYQGKITIDTINGVSGVSYPIGTPTLPVDNWDDAATIALDLSLDSIDTRNAITFTSAQDVSDFVIKGQHAYKSLITFDNNDCQDLDITGVSITGTFGDGFVILKEGRLVDASNVEGTFYNVAISGTITIAATPANGTRRTSFFSCYSDMPGTARPTIDCNGTTHDIQIRDYNGGLTILNFTSGNSMTIDAVAARIVLDATCTAGEIVVRGTGILVDNSGVGCTVDSSGLVYGDDVRLARDHARATNAQTQNA